MIRNMDIHGNRAVRLQKDYPYSFDTVTLYKKGYLETDLSECSDRLSDRDADRFRMCAISAFGDTGQNFSRRDPEQIARFLSAFLERKIELTGIEESCNWSTGYPYWTFCFREVDDVR